MRCVLSALLLAVVALGCGEEQDPSAAPDEQMYLYTCSWTQRPPDGPAGTQHDSHVYCGSARADAEGAFGAAHSSCVEGYVCTVSCIRAQEADDCTGVDRLPSEFDVSQD
jgi:hypothetical protein